MLPAAKTHRFSLADVLPNSLAAVRGEPNGLRLPRVRHAIVVLVDGLGAGLLAEHAGHARTILGRSSGGELGTVVPSTTAAALATLTTGEAPGRHGLVGYLVHDPAGDRLINSLTGWGSDVDPASWQRVPTIFERTTDVPVFAVGPGRYADSGFTAAVLRGADYRSGESVADRMAAVRRIGSEADRSLSYLYVPELDIASHAKGTRSAAWVAALEDLDAGIATLLAALPGDTGVLLTADHGAVDVAFESHVLLPPELLDGVRHVAGEPRFLHLITEPAAAAALAGRWREREGARAWVATREEAVSAGWFGPVVDPEVLGRIGDVLVAPRRRIAYYADPDDRGRSMVGQHGSLTPEERTVPFRRFGAFRTAG